MTTQTSNGVITAVEPDTSHLDGYGVLFGWPIAHSLSPLLHQTIFKALGLQRDYFLLPSTNIQQFLNLVRGSKCYGSGVTMPHKVAIIPELDELAVEASRVGAVNTVFWRNSKLIGTNTDIVGVRESFYQNVPRNTFEGRPALVFGGGGAARSAVYALVEYMGCETVYLVNRDPAEVEAVIDWCKSHGYGDGIIHVSTSAQAENLEGPGAIVACIPNYPPVTDAELEARRVFECFLNKPQKGAILEMCYHPVTWTEIAEISKKAGWNVILGTDAMIFQGFEQARLWTGREMSELPVEQVKEAVAQRLSKGQP